MVVIGTDCIGSYKSNYHTIMTRTVPMEQEKLILPPVPVILNSDQSINPRDNGKVLELAL